MKCWCPTDLQLLEKVMDGQRKPLGSLQQGSLSKRTQDWAGSTHKWWTELKSITKAKTEGFADNAPEGGWLRRYSHLPGAPSGCLTCKILWSQNVSPQYEKHTEAGRRGWISSELTSQPYRPSVVPTGKGYQVERAGLGNTCLFAWSAYLSCFSLFKQIK